jgi:hypothetical protein
MMLFRTEPVYKNVSIAILDRIHKLLLKPRRNADHRGHIKDLQIRPPRTDIRARLAVGRQPAEGGAGQMADASAEAC